MMAKKAKKSKQKQRKTATTPKTTKPTKPTKQATVRSRVTVDTAPVQAERPQTSALTITRPTPRQYHPNEAVFSISRRKHVESHDLLVKLCGKQIGKVPIPMDDPVREEVDIITRMLIRRMAELMGECKTQADVPAAATRIAPVLKLFPLLGEAYL